MCLWRTSTLQSVSVSPARAPDRLGLMTWPDSSKQPSAAMINESDLLISGEYGLLYQKPLLETQKTALG